MNSSIGNAWEKFVSDRSHNSYMEFKSELACNFFPFLREIGKMDDELTSELAKVIASVLGFERDKEAARDWILNISEKLSVALSEARKLL